MKKSIKRINYICLIVLIFTNITTFAIEKVGTITSAYDSGIIEDSGYLPSPVEIKKGVAPALNKFNLYEHLLIPETYDLRNQLLVTPVKNQDPTNTCWAFAGTSVFESALKKNNIGIVYDYSEANLNYALTKYTSDGQNNSWGYDRVLNSGGNFEMVMAYLSRGSGPVLEANDTFIPGATPAPRLVSVTNNKTKEKYATKMYQLPPLDYTITGQYTSTANYTDAERQQQIIETKQLILDYGVAFCSYYNNSNYYNSNNPTNEMSYYYPYAEIGRENHAVSIVGWNDNFLATNFKEGTRPPGNGAFLIKNSWGINWGNSGYFWLSYYDKYVSSAIGVIAEVKDVKYYDNIYQYDPLGVTATYAYEYPCIVGANKFTASQSGEILKAVAFNTAETNLSYKIYVNANDQHLNEDALTEVASGTLEHAGYHTIDLPVEQTITGTQFAVAVKLINSGNISPTFQLEIPYTGYSSKATSNANEGFVFLDILPAAYEEYWDDASVDDPDSEFDIFGASICLKAFTDSPTSSVSFYNGNDELITSTTDNDTVVSNIKVRGASGNTKAVLATYKDNKLENISYQPVVKDSINVFNSTFPSGSGYTFKSMLIDEDTMKPFIKSGYTITK